MIIVKGHPNLINTHSYKKIVIIVAIWFSMLLLPPTSNSIIYGYKNVFISYIYIYIPIGLIGPQNQVPISEMVPLEDS